ncbi:MAG: hypothetical protein ABL999_03485 [Pyrinomonadaceae bacterium]
MKNYSTYFYGVLLVVNIAFAGHFINRWVDAKPTVRQLPSNLVTENSLVNAEILKLSGNLDNKKIAVALMSSKATICAGTKLGDFFRATQSERPDIKLFVLFSNNTSAQDISTFRDNLRLDFEGVPMNSELDDYWEGISQKYDTPVIIILNNRNGLFASQDLPEIRKALETY